MTKPLDGIRILDLGRVIAAPWATQVLADMGAEVIKIERPGQGDYLRQCGPAFLKDKEGNPTRESGQFLTVNRNKKSICIDIQKQSGADLVRKLAEICDVCIENFIPGTLERYGLAYEDLSRINPNIIYCSITGFGQTGPYKDRGGVDGVFQGMSGLMSVTGEPGSPQRSGVFMVDELCGMYASTAILGALRQREVLGGKGQHIDLSLLDIGVAAMATRTIEYLLDGTVPTAIGSKSPGSAPAQLFQCKDGLLNIQAGAEPHYRKLCDVLGLSEYKEHPLYAKRMDRVRNLDSLVELIESKTRNWTMADLWTALVEKGVLAGPVYTVDQMVDDPQVKHRQMIRSVPHPLLSELPMTANPIRTTGFETDYNAPPMIGQHTDEVLRDVLKLSDAEIQALNDEGVLTAPEKSRR